MYGPDEAILLMYGSHDMRHVDFRGLTVVNETPRFWSFTFFRSQDTFDIYLCTLAMPQPLEKVTRGQTRIKTLLIKYPIRVRVSSLVVTFFNMMDISDRIRCINAPDL